MKTSGLASAGQGQYDFVRDRLAFGNLLRPANINGHAEQIGPQALTVGGVSSFFAKHAYDRESSESPRKHRRKWKS